MIYVDLILNLSLLVAITVVSGFIERRWPYKTILGTIMQGTLFGATAILGMLRPLNLGPGLIFDGRSVMVSLCALFFGPWAASVAVVMTVAWRITIGGVGALTGSLVILSSAGIGVFSYFRFRPQYYPPSLQMLYFFGLAVHVAMLAMMFTLPGSAGMIVIKRIGLPVMLLYPLATILAGKILSDQVRAEQSARLLRESEELYKTLVENIDFGVTMINSDFKIIMTNAIYGKWFDRPVDEFVGKSCFEEFEKRQAICPHCPGVKAMATGRPHSVETEGIRDDGSRISVAVSAFPLFNQDGSTRGFIEVVENITERKRLEEQLRQAQKMEAIGTLAGGIAHDFNNLLMAIQGYTFAMLGEVDSGSPHYEKLKAIEGQIESGANITRELLGFARKGKYEVRHVNLNEVLEKSSALFGRTKKEIIIHKKFRDDLWAVEADTNQMEQVLMNLYINSWQAMPQGGHLYLETANVVLTETDMSHSYMKPGRYVKVTVTDTGKGMDEKTKERIFEPFFTTKEMGRGTGLGLAMVYGIVKGHDGYINVYSEEGKGTTFKIYLPASEKRAVKEETAAAEIFRGEGTILVVDDEKEIAGVMAQFLEALGYSVLTANNGVETLKIYGENKDKIDLVILDMIMPEMGGGETFDRLKEMNPAIKVILSSGYSLNGQASEIMGRGCMGFIQKPVNIAELSKKIRDVLGDEEGSRVYK